jgi:hypothetical protein
MANEEQLKILKQGIEIWNQWRRDDRTVFVVDLNEADLRGINLHEADLDYADLRKADLSRANLSLATLRGAKLNNAILHEANLYGTQLCGADLSGANLIKAKLGDANLEALEHIDGDVDVTNLHNANLSDASLFAASFHDADLSGASLVNSSLFRTNLWNANLANANLNGASLGETLLVNNDLKNTQGLESVGHSASSTIGTDTLSRSKGKIPEVFLRGCGLSDWEIEAAKLYNPELTNEERNKILYKIYDLQASQAVQISPLFISYSHADGDFVDRIEQPLNEKGIRFWRDIHDMKAGRIEKQIDRAIRHNPTVLLVLTKDSIQSDWVEHEVRLARKLEKETERDVLCPVALDDSWKNSNWPQRIMEQVMEFNILDFSEWKDDEKFKRMFVRLIDGLNLYYKKEAAS